MHNIGLLIKNYIKIFLGNLTNKKQNRNLKWAIVLVLLFALIFIVMFSSLALTSIITFMEHDPPQPELALYTNGLMVLMFIALMTVTKSAIPSKARDEELLLALPVKKSQIIVSKLLYNYLFDLLVVVMTLLPTYIIYYFLVDNVSVMLVIRGLLIVMMLPFLSTGIGTIIGIFFSRIASRFKRFNIIQTLLNLGFLLLFLVGYIYINQFMIPENVDNILEIINFFPIRWMVNFILYNGWVYFIYILLASIIPFSICILLQNRFLGHDVQRYRSKKTEIIYREYSPTKALLLKEITRYFNTPIYLINTFFGAILQVIFAFVIVIMGKSFFNSLFNQINLPILTNNFPYLIFVVLVFCISTVVTTSSSISLEGKNFWILKAHPIAELNIFYAKILLNLIITIFPIILSSVMVSFIIGWEYLFFMIVIQLLIIFANSTIGLYINILFPRLEWDTETVPVKQGMSVFLSMIFSFVISLVPILLYFAFTKIISSIVYLTILIGIYGLINLLLYLLLVKKGIPKFRNIN